VATIGSEWTQDDESKFIFAPMRLFTYRFDGTNKEATGSRPMAKQKPIIPEPSPRTLSLSLVGGALLILAVVLVDYANGLLR
jgi:hypothetical protein